MIAVIRLLVVVLLSRALVRFTAVDARDWARLLHWREDYGVTELPLEAGDGLAGRRLGETRLAGEGALVLDIECPGNHFLGAPGADTELRGGDGLLVYGRTPRIAELDGRGSGASGDQRHSAAVEEQVEINRSESASARRS